MKLDVELPRNLFFSKVEKLEIEAGDMVLFDQRVLHAGGAINYREPKVSIFFAVGLKNQHSINHLNFLKYRNHKGFILECRLNFKTTNVSKKNKSHPKIVSKNLAIFDFLNCEIGIASFFQPKWTSLFAVLIKLSLVKVSMIIKS